MNTHLLTALLVAGNLVATSKPATKSGKKKVDISIGSLPDLPKADGLQDTREEQKVDETKAPVDPAKSTYKLVSITHAEQFVQRGDNYDARHPISRIEVVNLPMTVATFHTLVRVHSDDKLGATIEVRLLDPRGSQVLSSQGSLVFGGHPEADFLIDWDPFTLQKSGTYQVVVAVAGQEIGKVPFQVVQELNAKLVPTAAPAPAPAPAPEQPKETWP